MILSFFDISGTFTTRTECKGVCVTETMDGAAKTLSFSVDGRLSSIRTEMTTVCDGTKFLVKEIRPDQDADRIEIDCVIDLSELDGIWVTDLSPVDLTYSAHEGIDYGENYDMYYDQANPQPTPYVQDVISAMHRKGFLPPGWSARFLTAPLTPGQEPPTGWRLLFLNGVYSADKITATEAIQKLAQMVYCHTGNYRIDNINKTIYFGAVGYGEKPYGHTVPFISGHNMQNLMRTESSRELITRLYAYGKGDLTLASVCSGREYVENHTYSQAVKIGTWTNSDIEAATVLKEAAEERLSILSRPTVSYSADVVDLASIRDDADSLAYAVGEYALLEDATISVHEKIRIVKTTRYPDEPERNSIEFGSPIPTLEDFDNEMRILTAQWTKVTNPDGSVNGVYVHGVQAGDVVGIETVITQAGAVRDAVVSVINDVIGS